MPLEFRQDVVKDLPGNHKVNSKHVARLQIGREAVREGVARKEVICRDDHYQTLF